MRPALILSLFLVITLCSASPVKREISENEYEELQKEISQLENVLSSIKGTLGANEAERREVEEAAEPAATVEDKPAVEPVVEPVEEEEAAGEAAEEPIVEEEEGEVVEAAEEEAVEEAPEEVEAEEEESEVDAEEVDDARVQEFLSQLSPEDKALVEEAVSIYNSRARSQVILMVAHFIWNDISPDESGSYVEKLPDKARFLIAELHHPVNELTEEEADGALSAVDEEIEEVESEESSEEESEEDSERESEGESEGESENVSEEEEGGEEEADGGEELEEELEEVEEEVEEEEAEAEEEGEVEEAEEEEVEEEAEEAVEELPEPPRPAIQPPAVQPAVQEPVNIEARRHQALEQYLDTLSEDDKQLLHRVRGKIEYLEKALDEKTHSNRGDGEECAEGRCLEARKVSKPNVGAEAPAAEEEEADAPEKEGAKDKAAGAKDKGSNKAAGAKDKAAEKKPGAEEEVNPEPNPNVQVHDESVNFHFGAAMDPAEIENHPEEAEPAGETGPFKGDAKQAAQAAKPATAEVAENEVAVESRSFRRVSLKEVEQEEEAEEEEEASEGEVEPRLSTEQLEMLKKLKAKLQELKASIHAQEAGEGEEPAVEEGAEGEAEEERRDESASEESGSEEDNSGEDKRDQGPQMPPALGAAFKSEKVRRENEDTNAGAAAIGTSFKSAKERRGKSSVSAIGTSFKTSNTKREGGTIGTSFLNDKTRRGETPDGTSVVHRRIDGSQSALDEVEERFLRDIKYARDNGISLQRLFSDLEQRRGLNIEEDIEEEIVERDIDEDERDLESLNGNVLSMQFR